MSRDIYIYTRKKEPIPRGEIVSSLVARGFPAQVKGNPLSSGQPEVDALLGVGDTYAILVGSDEISVSSRLAADADKRSLLKSYQRVLDEAQRAHLLVAERIHEVVSGRGVTPEREKLLKEIVALIAEKRDGLILDTMTNQFSDAAGYRGGSDTGSLN